MLLITYVIVSLLVIMSIGSLLALSNNPHWFIRGWDFPHVQMAILTIVACLVYFACAKWIFVEESIDVVWQWIVAGLALFLLSRLLYGILPYTPLLRPQTKLAVSGNDDYRISLVITNVEMENDQYDNRTAQTRRLTLCNLKKIPPLHSQWAGLII
jgi:endonuclease/exonuclease/phosphatase (EEP) superfamily protein YafD